MGVCLVIMWLYCHELVVGCSHTIGIGVVGHGVEDWGGDLFCN